MNVIFFGSSAYSLPLISTLHDNFRLRSLICKTSSQEIIQFARQNKITLFTPRDVAQLLNVKKELSGKDIELAVVADYGFIIPESVYNFPRLGTLNIHFSLLPMLRGPSPVQYTILFGYQTAGYCVIVTSDKIDAGNIIFKQSVPDIDPRQETQFSLYQKLFQHTAGKLPQIFKDYEKGRLKKTKQDEKMATFTRALTRQDGYIPISYLRKAQSGNEEELPNSGKDPAGSLILQALQKDPRLPLVIERAIRAFNPWPSVWTLLFGKKRLKFHKAHLEKNQLAPDLVQLEGKNPVSYKQFLEGYPQMKNQLHL